MAMVLQQCPPDDRRPLEAKDQYRMELAELEPLTVSEELALVEQARAGSQEAAYLLLESCLPYAFNYARRYAEINKVDALDAAQAGNEAMVRHMPEALKARNIRGFLRFVAKCAVYHYCIEDKLIRVPRTSFEKGKRGPLVVSLTAPLRKGSNLTPFDLIEIATM